MGSKQSSWNYLLILQCKTLQHLENLVFGVWCKLCSKSGDLLVEIGAPNMFAPMLTSRYVSIGFRGIQ